MGLNSGGIRMTAPPVEEPQRQAWRRNERSVSQSEEERYEERRKRRRTSSELFSSASPGWIRVGLCCVVVSIIVQLLLPFLSRLSETAVCRVAGPQLGALISCHSSSAPAIPVLPSELPRRHENEVTYFVEPNEPWMVEEEEPQTETRPQVAPLPGRTVDPAREVEALAALVAAVQNRLNGNLRKAGTIIEHAIALAPSHPDIVTEYGIYMETARRDVLLAEGFYRKALRLDPQHSEALQRRNKALPLVEKLDAAMLKEIHAKKAFFRSIPRQSSALRRALRESYFAHVYHTVAMEGNTMSLHQTRSILETRMAVAGKSIVEHNEILGMDSALRFLNRSLVNAHAISLDDILEIHRRVLGFVDPDEAGRFRRTQVYVGSFTPAAPHDVIPQMREFVDWLNDDETLRLDPVEVAAIAHYKLVFIHPFVDGNGRTARLLLNLILMQNGFPPVIVPVEARNRYYETLIEANQGDLRPFIRFIAAQTSNALQALINAVQMCEESSELSSSTSCSSTISVDP